MTERRTQADRSAATRAALVDAAILLLIERGWGATTSVAVCEVANVTRGALNHHYADLGELLSEALIRVCDDFDLGRGESATTVCGLVDRTWAIVGDRRFKAVMEAWWAAGNDKDIARTVRPVMSRVATLVAPDNSKVPHIRRTEVKTFVTVSREALLGMAMGRATNGGNPLPHEKAVIASLRDQARELDLKYA